VILAHLGEELIPALVAGGATAGPALLLVLRARLTRFRELVRRRS
jgi:hypothetical protein